MKVVEVINVDFSLRHFLLPLMRAGRAAGHDVIGACQDGDLLGPVRAEGFRVVALPPMRGFSVAALARAYAALVRLFRSERPDLVHAHMPISGFVARMAAWRAGVPRVAYTSHGFLFNQPGPWWRRAASFMLEWLAGRVTDVFLTVSEEEARDARRLRIARRPVAVRNGRPGAVFHPDPAARARIRVALGEGADAVVAVVVSRLVRHKGHAELAAAVADIEGLTLWVVGERLPTDRGPDVAAMLERAGLGSRLRMLGYRDDVAAVLAAADIFVLPSHFEGLPMSIVEAMLTGLPVVATDISGPREQVRDGETGLIVSPMRVAPLRAALARLAEDAGLRARMGAAGRTRALACYEEEVVLERTLAALGLTRDGERG